MWTHIRSQNRPVRGHTRRFFPQTFVDGISCLLGFDVFPPPEASRREEEHCAESARPSGQEVRFTKPCGTAVTSIHKGMWRRLVLCGRPVACTDISQQYSRSPKNPALQLLQKSSKSASTTPQRPIWNTFGTVAFGRTTVRRQYEGALPPCWLRGEHGAMSEGKYRALIGHYQLRDKVLIGCFALSGCLFMGRFYVLICRGSTHEL